MGDGSGNSGSGNTGQGANGGNSGSGKGDGGNSSEMKTDVIEETMKIKGKLQAGEIVGKYFKRGISPTGEKAKKFAGSVNSAKSEAQDAMTQQGIPSEYRELVKKYFDSLRNIHESDKPTPEK